MATLSVVKKHQRTLHVALQRCKTITDVKMYDENHKYMDKVEFGFEESSNFVIHPHDALLQWILQKSRLQISQGQTTQDTQVEEVEGLREYLVVVVVVVVC